MAVWRFDWEDYESWNIVTTDGFKYSSTTSYIIGRVFNAVGAYQIEEIHMTYPGDDFAIPIKFVHIKGLDVAPYPNYPDRHKGWFLDLMRADEPIPPLPPELMPTEPEPEPIPEPIENPITEPITLPIVGTINPLMIIIPIALIGLFIFMKRRS